MKAVRTLGLAVVMGAALTTAALAKDLKMAYVDLSRLFDNYEKTKEYDAVLQKESEGYQKEREAMINKVRDAQSKLALLKEDQKQKMQVDIDKQKGELIEYDKKKREELAKKRDEKVREILLEIEKVVSELAQKEGYDFILNDRVLIYGDQSQNLTDRVLKAVNEAYRKK